MSRVVVTGATDGIGLESVRELLAAGHGRYVKRFEVQVANLEASDLAVQGGLIVRLAEITGVALPR